jgi:hypothetical protein
MNDPCEHRNMRAVWTKLSSYGDEYLKSRLRNYCDDCGDLVGSALDAVTCFIETEERRQRGRHRSSEGRLCVKTDSWGKGPAAE